MILKTRLDHFLYFNIDGIDSISLWDLKLQITLKINFKQLKILNSTLLPKFYIFT